MLRWLQHTAGLGSPLRPAIEPPTAADQAPAQVTVRHRGISELDSTPRVIIGLTCSII
jgi:hypothetical protein